MVYNIYGDVMEEFKYCKVEVFIPKDFIDKLCEVFNKLENYDDSVVDFITKFQAKYLQDRLPNYYYIPFGRMGDYKMSNLELFAFIANVVMKELRGGNR